MTRDTSPTPLPAVRDSSGDPLADGRYLWARSAEEQGDFAAAADLYLQVLERAPAWAPAWFALGHVREQLGNPAGAAQAFRRAAHADQGARLGAELRLARLGAAPPPPRPSEAYVTQLFETYAPRFERHLVETLRYRGPEQMRLALAALGPQAPSRFAHAIDLGCGTGLVGRAFAGLAERLTGIDLAPAMVAAARATGLYDRLVVGEAVAFLAAEPAGSADLVLAADVLIYIGALEPLMAALAHALRPGGLFLATLQAAEGAGWSLGEDLRYAHSGPYVREVAAPAGLRLVHVEPASPRREHGRDVPGLVIALAKT